MPDLSKIKLNDTVYNLKDAEARQSINNLKKIHILDFQTYINERYDEELDLYEASLINVTYSDIHEWKNNNELVAFYNSGAEHNMYYLSDSDRGVLIFSNISGAKLFVYSNNNVSLNGDTYVTANNIPYYDSQIYDNKYGVCNTAADTAAKTVTIDDINELYEGLYIFVKFANANAIASPTLQVNSLDAKPIKRYGTTAPSTSAASSWNAGSVVLLIYDGNYWQMEEWNNTTYSSMTTSEISAGTGTTARTITPARLKTAIETWAPVQSVNGDTGSVIVDQLQTTAGNDNTEYNLIGTNTSNTNNAAVDIYNPGLISFSKYDNNFARLTLGSTATPGELRLYTSASGASGYIDLKSAASSTNTRTITLPDATGTVALTSDIPNISSWALAANKPSYTFSELTSHPTSIGGYGITDAYTKTEVDGLVSGVLHYKGTKATVSALPSSGNTTGDVWHITADGSEWAWDGSNWQELGTAVDLSGYVPTSRTVNGKALTSDISLTASDVSALPSSTTYVSSFNGESGAITYTAPVTSVNGQTGAVTITDSDEKVKTVAYTADSTAHYIVFGANSSGTETKKASSQFTYSESSSINQSTLSIGKSAAQKGRIYLNTGDSTSGHGTYLVSTATTGRTISLPDATGTLALTSDIPTTASDVGALADDCAAAGITSTDISNWNAKVSDDKTWNGVALTTTETQSNGAQYIPIFQSKQLSGNASMLTVTSTPTAYKITKYDANAYLKSTTPTSGDSSTKVATTAFVGTAISNISIPQPYNASTNPTGYLTINDLPIYDGTVI